MKTACQDTKESLERKRIFVRQQIKEAKETGFVTIRGRGKIPLWRAFRCLYCCEYYDKLHAEIHFGMTRKKYFAT